MRILVTGSREWDNRQVIEKALRPYAQESAVLVSGACPSGADRMAEEIWEGWGLSVERHPANWKLGRGAGLIRNRLMVDTGPDVCLAFRKNYSRGTTHCANFSRFVSSGCSLQKARRMKLQFKGIGRGI